MKKSVFFICSFLTFFVFVISGCSNFLNGTEFKNQLYEIIEYYNSEEKAVYVMADDAVFGTTTPNMVQNYKVSPKDNNKIIFRPSDGYFFKYWEVVDRNTKEKLTGIINIEDKLALETSFSFIKNTDHEILIRPVCIPRPSFVSAFPQEGTTNPKDVPVVLNFSTRLSEENDFSKISFFCDNMDITDNFQAPIFYENTIYFSSDNKNMIDIPEGKTKTITVTIPEDFFYIDGDGTKITLGKEKSWSFQVNNSLTDDKLPPVIANLSLSKFKDKESEFTKKIYTEWTENEFYQNHTKEVWLNCTVNDNGMGIKGLKIQETFIKKNDGTGESYPVVNETPYYGTFTRATVDSFIASDFVYQFKADTDGMVKLDIWAEDYAGNLSSVPETYYFAKDTCLEEKNGKDSFSYSISMAPKDDEDGFVIRKAVNNRDKVSFDRVEIFKDKFFGNRQSHLDVKLVYWNEGEVPKELFSFNNYTETLESKDDVYYKKINDLIIDRPADQITFLKLTVKDDANNILENEGFIPPVPKYISYSFDENTRNLLVHKKSDGEYYDLYKKNNDSLTFLDNAPINFCKSYWGYMTPTFILEPDQANYELTLFQDCNIPGFHHITSPLGTSIKFSQDGIVSGNTAVPPELKLPDFEIKSDDFVPNSQYRTIFVKLTSDYNIPAGYDYSIVFESDGIIYETNEFQQIVGTGICSVYLVAKNDSGEVLRNPDGTQYKTEAKTIDVSRDCTPPSIHTIASNFTIGNSFTVKLYTESLRDLVTSYDWPGTTATLDFVDDKLKLYYWFENDDENPVTKEQFIEIDDCSGVSTSKPLLYSIPVNGLPATAKKICFKIYDKEGNYDILKESIKSSVYNASLEIKKITSENDYKFRIEFPENVLLRKTSGYYGGYSTYMCFDSTLNKWTQVYPDATDIENSVYYSSWENFFKAGNAASRKHNYKDDCGYYSQLNLNLANMYSVVNKSFVRFKFITEDASYKTMYLYPDYYVNDLTVDTKALIGADNGAVIFADKPCFIHTLYCSENLGDDPDLWATKGLEVKPLFKDITEKTFFTYEVSPAEIPENNFYCIVAHFADGTSYKTKEIWK